MLDEELLKCYNLKHNYRAKYLQNKQKRRNEMRFVVILKQIPDDSIKDEYQDVDQLNDSDKNVIKEALDLRDRYGETVDVIGFGPLSAEDVMKETLTYGIDRGSRKTFEGKRSFIVSYSIRMWDQRRGKEALQLWS